MSRTETRSAAGQQGAGLLRPIERDPWRCFINRARSVNVYAQRSRGQPPIKSDSRVTA
ncbi:MAG: hypothetical protein V3Q69_13990 (plasmid) [Burkholderia sp.]